MRKFNSQLNSTLTNMNYGTRNVQPIGGDAPIRGSFPRDHLHECSKMVENYFKCLSENKYYAPRCRREMKAYLDCRLDHGLMTEADYEEAQIPDVNAPLPEIPEEITNGSLRHQKERRGFIAGLGLMRGRQINEQERELEEDEDDEWE